MSDDLRVAIETIRPGMVGLDVGSKHRESLTSADHDLAEVTRRVMA